MLNEIIRKNKDLTLVAGVILILVILFSPIPPVLLDLAIILNFGFAFTILLLTFYVAKPVEFSTFPSILLVATLFRLSLNVAATRLILTSADAGDVINAIGSYAVQGSFIVGLVVFSILVVVQYVVVTNGAQRVSEVAARFTLDSMPGQQMSIDADLNMGLIDQKEAAQRRENLGREASFYGSMDGASKFVKGDAIAGIIILLIDIIAGWIIGVAQMGMSWSEALAHFTLLTIGDGIATQLPALIISVATGIIVTRSSSDKDLTSEVFKQLSSVPKIPLIVAVVLTAMLLLPGMPKWPIVLVVALALFAYWKNRQARRQNLSQESALDEIEAEDSGAVAALELQLGSGLAEHWASSRTEMLDRISAMRRNFEKEFGFFIPPMRVIEGPDLSSRHYAIVLFGSRYAEDGLEPDKLLAIGGNEKKGELPGRPATDPAFGMPGYWIAPELVSDAESKGYSVIDPLTVLLTHATEVIRSEIGRMLTRPITVEMLEAVRLRQPGLIEELLPNLMSVSDIQRVFQMLLAETVSISNYELILEHLADLARHHKDPVQLTEMIRQRMSFAICSQLRGHHADLEVLSLEPRLENQIATSIRSGGDAGETLLDPVLTDKLLRSLAPLANAMFNKGRNPVLLCGDEVRRHIKRLTRRSLPKLSVLGLSEIPERIRLKSFAVVELES
jgi:flagellar biosynthesis protein FlhA